MSETRCMVCPAYQHCFWDKNTASTIKTNTSEHLSCRVLSLLQASLYLQGSGEVRERLCFLPSASLLVLDLIIIVSHCEHIQAHRLKKPLNINLSREANFLDDIINQTIFFILIKLQIFYILPSYSPTSFMLHPHQTDIRIEREGQNQISKMNSESTLHCCKAHFAESTESNLKHRQKKPS